MSNRYVIGEVNPVIAPVALAQVVAKFDVVGLSANTIIRAQDIAVASVINAPAAPTVANNAVAIGSPLTNALTNVKISYQFPWGEGALSAAGNATPIAGGALVVSGASLTPPVLNVLPGFTAPAYTNVYVETAAGSGVFKLWGITYGETVLVTSYGAGQAPFANNVGGVAAPSDAFTVTQYNFQQLYLGVSGQRKDLNIARVFGNGTDGVIRIDTSGVFEFDSASFQYQVGMLVGPDNNGTTLLNQQVKQVVHDTLAIGQVVEQNTNLLKVKAQLLSRQVPLALQF